MIYNVDWVITASYQVEADSYEEAENYVFDNEELVVLKGVEEVGITIGEIEEIE
jgi:hypothetical protein